MTTNSPQADIIKSGLVKDAFFEMYPNVGIRGIYCQMTGKRIGLHDWDEINALIDSIPGDPESISDDIAMRIFASMRPSLHWNKLRADSLEVMRKTRPVETLAYLLNRLYTPLSRDHDTLAVNHDRIRVYARCAEWGVCESSATLMYYLLEIDARLGLHVEWPTFTLTDVLTQPWPILLEMAQAWHARRLKAYADLIKKQEQNTKFWRSGNALARPAFFSAWMESQPVSPNQQRLADKKAESDFFGGILFELMGKPNLDGEQTAPVPEPAKVVMPRTQMPKRFGKAA